MDTFLFNEIEKTSEHITELFELALQNEVEELNNMELFLKMKEKLTLIKTDLETDNRGLDLAQESSTVEEFENKLDSFYKKEKRKSSSSIRRTNNFKDFKKTLENIKSSVLGVPIDEDISLDDFVMEAVVNVYDPLTKLRMTDPVKNKICGHHYEHSSIMEAIKLNKRLRCPVAGCGNKEIVTKTHIERDEAMKITLMNMPINDEEV